MSRAIAWARAYARQARADLETWEQLRKLDAVPGCHKLQFIRMACEKLTKAHLCRAGSDPGSLQSSHAYIARSLPIIIRRESSRTKPGNADWVNTHSIHLAREIELLAPAVKRGGQRPDNCEYPWEDEGGRVYSPIDWTFAPSSMMLAAAGRTFLKLVRDAINRLIWTLQASPRPHRFFNDSSYRDHHGC